MTKTEIGCLFSNTLEMKEKRVRRVFSTELKVDLVKKIERGELRPCDIKRTYGVSNSAIYKWLNKYSDLYGGEKQLIVEKKSLSQKNKELHERIKELEQALGKKAMRVDYLERVISSASDRLGEDIEKKSKGLS